MPPSDFWRCSLWEFSAALSGWAKANGAEEKLEAPSDEEFDAMLERHGFA